MIYKKRAVFIQLFFISAPMRSTAETANWRRQTVQSVSHCHDMHRIFYQNVHVCLSPESNESDVKLRLFEKNYRIRLPKKPAFSAGSNGEGVMLNSFNITAANSMLNLLK
ncbi:hypothetical protein CS954_02365 [Bacillus siamensis]|nr:hypothetical protein CS954_02365 [Bacillus siamensis]